MEFWIIKNGERVGPFPDYSLREMIRQGEVKATTKVWHEQAEGWTEAQEVGVLSREFEVLQEERESVAVSATPPPIPQKVDWSIIWRRLGARWFDASLSVLLFVVIARVAGLSLKVEPGDEVSGWLVLVQFMPALLFEGILVHLIAQTPGKWLMGLQIKTREGSRLALGASVMRSMRIWVLGLGMGIAPLAIIGHLFALWMIKKNGVPLWDLMTGFQVNGRVLKPLRLIAFFVCFVLVWCAVIWVMWPHLEPDLQQAWEEAAERSLK